MQEMLGAGERLERAWQRCRFAEADWLTLGVGEGRGKQKNMAHISGPFNQIMWKP